VPDKEPRFMLTKSQQVQAAFTRCRLGTTLVWLGVLAWVPFIGLRIAGYTPSPLWFLPFHLVGVIGGSRLRLASCDKGKKNSGSKNWFRTIGHTLILLGVLVWAVYFYQKLVLDRPVEAVQFLPYHLTGVLSGVGFVITGTILSRIRNGA
jgi:hypothetical protein